MLVKGNICCKKSNCTKNIKRHTNISSATIHRNNIYGCFLLLTPRLAQKKKKKKKIPTPRLSLVPGQHLLLLFLQGSIIPSGC